MTSRTALLPATLRIFDLSLGQMLWARRSVFLAVLAGAPVALALALRVTAAAAPGVMPVVDGTRLDGPTLFGTIVWLVYIRFVVPVLGVFHGTAIIADEVDDKTITYLFTRPVPRAAVLFGKYLSYLVCTILLVLPSVIFVYFIVVPIGGGRIGSAFPALLADVSMLALGLAAYGALFALVGTCLKRPLATGLVFTFGWEPAVLLFPGYLKRLTVGYYLQGLVPHALPRDSAVGSLVQSFLEIPSALTGVASLGVLIGLALWFAARTVERREYVLEQ
jgi:ABC-type transport system involved in multi-copper enzyme maturation permease subunit